MYLQQARAGKQWKIATIRGHDVKVSLFFLGLVALFVFMGLNSASVFFHQLMWAPVLFLSILLHELGHAAATKKCGFGTSEIILHGLGGVAINRRGHTSPKQGMFISLAGPAVTLLLAVVFLPLLIAYQVAVGPEATGAITVLGHFLSLMVLVNFFLLIFNLLPIFPLDGGQTLMHFLRRKKGQSEAMLLATKISLGTLVVSGFLTLMLFPGGGFFILLIFGLLGFANWQTLQQLTGRRR